MNFVDDDDDAEEFFYDEGSCDDDSPCVGAGPVEGALVGLPTASATRGDMGCDLLSLEEAQLIMDTDIQKFSNFANTSPAVAMVLLRQHRFEVEAALEAYFLRRDSETASFDLGDVTKHDGRLVANTSEVECPVCYSDEPPGGAFALPICRHWMCRTCREDFFRIHVEAADDLVALRCGSRGCRNFIGQTAILQILEANHANLLPRVRRHFLNVFLSLKNNISRCPNPMTCDAIIRCRNVVTESTEGKCGKCGLVFCMSCHQHLHAPATCHMLRNWSALTEEGKQSNDWLLKNTKPCPSCCVSMEKSSGCNHMRCTCCQHEFCWVCLGDWARHRSNYHCSKTLEIPFSEIRNRSTNSAHQFLAHLERFTLHQSSMALDLRSLKNVRAAVNATSLNSRVWFSSPALVEEMEQTLFLCRRALQYSYVYRYYTKEGTKKDLFIDRQVQLESATEELSFVLSGKICQTADLVNQRLRAAQRRLELFKDDVG